MYNFAFVFNGKVSYENGYLEMKRDEASWYHMLLTHSKRDMRVRCTFSEGTKSWRQAVEHTVPGTWTMGEVCRYFFTRRREAFWDVTEAG